MIKGHVLLLFISWFCLGIELCNAQSIDPKNFVIKHWGMEEGLPQSSVNDIIQTDDGYLWLATFGGLVRFDGHSFKTFDRSNTKGMITDRLLKIRSDSEGGIWLFPELTETAILRFKDGICTAYPIQKGLSNVTDIIEDSEGRVWATAFEKYYLLKDNSFVEIAILNDNNAREKALDENGSWLASGKNLYKSLGDTIVLISENIAGINSDIIKLDKSPYEANTLLLGTGLDGVYRINVKNEPNVKSIIQLPHSYFLDFIFDNDNNIFAISAEGISVYEDNSFQKFLPFGTQSTIRIKTIIQDHSGNYWLGTEGDGLYRLRESFITMIDEEKGLDNQKMLSLTKLKDGTMLFSTNCSGIYEWDGQQVRESRLHRHIEKGCFWTVFQDSKERIWIGGGAPYVTDNIEAKGKTFGEQDGFNFFGIYSMFELSDGKIFIGAGDGLSLYNGDSFETYTTEDGLFFNDVRTFLEDKDGTVWLGTKGGLNTFDNGRIEKIPLYKEDEQSLVRQPEVRSIYKDKDGYFWIGTYGSGLFRVKDDEIIRFTVKDGLFDDIVSHVIEDEFGYFWMGSNRGISRVSRQQLNEYAAGEIDHFSAFSYGISDGMNSAETNGGFSPSTIFDNGNIYFPTVEGVAVVNTRKAGQKATSPSVYIENIQTTDSIYNKQSAKIELPHDDSFLQIDYTAVELSNPDKIEFRYMMEGYHDKWIEVDQQRRAIFTKIPPGNYVFKVGASSIDGSWSLTNIAELSVIVIPPFWQTAWFFLLLVIFFIAVVPFTFYLQTKKLIKENERKKRFSEELINNQEIERRRIASELHDSLGQQILVIKNRAELAKLNFHQQKELVEQLDEIVMSAKSSIDSVRSISHNLRPVHLEKFGLTEAIESLCMEMQGSTNIEWTYQLDNIDDLIPKEKEINFYRVIQEALNNILKHSEATEASIFISVLPDKAVVSIADNGKGFDPEKIKEISSLGFLGMEERIESVGGLFSIKSFPGNGTILTLTILFVQKK